eukprot:2448873-Rhodomonas_salina.4
MIGRCISLVEPGMPLAPRTRSMLARLVQTKGYAASTCSHSTTQSGWGYGATRATLDPERTGFVA